MDPPRYAADDLLRFARVLLERAGLDTDKARAVADVLMEADLLGHDTHGLSLLASYLGELESGGMSRSGQPRVVHDKPAALTWDGKRLPGPWLVLKAIEAAIRQVLDANADAAADYRAGKTKTFGFLVGQVMKATGGKANPAIVNARLKKALD